VSFLAKSLEGGFADEDIEVHRRHGDKLVIKVRDKKNPVLNGEIEVTLK
jgi:hypothetical protein